MDTVQDFEDILELFARHRVRYLIVGGLAFIYHAKPRYTKDIDLWIDADRENVSRANRALEEFGSPMLMTIDAHRYPARDDSSQLRRGVATSNREPLRSCAG
jgi:hypothetical protein